MRKIKSTSFNVGDEFEKKLLAFAEQKENGNFSRYIKRLIERDRVGGGVVVGSATAPLPSPVTVASDKDVEMMESFL